MTGGGAIRLGVVGAVVAALAAAPAVLDRGLLFLLVEICAILAMAQMWNLLAGFAGLVSLGHHAFVGIGAYALFAMTRDLPISPYPAVLYSGLAAGLAVCSRLFVAGVAAVVADRGLSPIRMLVDSVLADTLILGACARALMGRQLVWRSNVLRIGKGGKLHLLGRRST